MSKLRWLCYVCVWYNSLLKIKERLFSAKWLQNLFGFLFWGTSSSFCLEKAIFIFKQASWTSVTTGQFKHDNYIFRTATYIILSIHLFTFLEWDFLWKWWHKFFGGHRTELNQSKYILSWGGNLGRYFGRKIWELIELSVVPFWDSIMQILHVICSFRTVDSLVENFGNLQNCRWLLSGALSCEHCA